MDNKSFWLGALMMVVLFLIYYNTTLEARIMVLNRENECSLSYIRFAEAHMSQSELTTEVLLKAQEEVEVNFNHYQTRR